MVAIVPLDKCCVGKSVRKSCLKCKRKYKRDNHRRVKQLKSEQIPNTRNVTIKKRSKYYEVLCAFCKEKSKMTFVPSVNVIMNVLKLIIFVSLRKNSSQRSNLPQLNNLIKQTLIIQIPLILLFRRVMSILIIDPKENQYIMMYCATIVKAK